MPHSSHQHKHKHHPQPPHTAGKPKAKRKAAVVLAVIGAIVGAFIAYITSNESTGWIIGAACIGIIAGYVFGHTIDKAVEKK